MCGKKKIVSYITLEYNYIFNAIPDTIILFVSLFLCFSSFFPITNYFILLKVQVTLEKRIVLAKL